MVVGAAGWALSVVFFVVQGIAQAAFVPPYDMATNLISDLGNTACGSAVCSPLHGVVNATFVVVGGLHWVGAVLTRSAWPRRRWGDVGRTLLALAGVGLILAGMAPENVNAAVHARGAIIGLIGLNLAMIVLGLSIVAARSWLGRLTVIAGALGLLGFGLMMTAAIPVGVAERLADYPGAAMVVVLGCSLLISVASRRRRSPGTPR